MSNTLSPTPPPPISRNAPLASPDTEQKYFGLFVALLPLVCALLISVGIYHSPPSVNTMQSLAYDPEAWTFIAVLGRYLETSLVRTLCLISVASGGLLWLFPRFRVCMPLAKVGCILAFLTAFIGYTLVYFNPPAVIVVM